MKTKEEILGPLRGKGNFIHCVDYEDALNAMEEYAESKLTDLLAVKQDEFSLITLLKGFGQICFEEGKEQQKKSSNLMTGDFGAITFARPSYLDPKPFLNSQTNLLPVSEAGEQEKHIVIMEGRVIDYHTYTHSDKYHLTIEVLGRGNYLGNNLKGNPEIELHHDNGQCKTAPIEKK